MIRGAVLGSPISHSLSPVLHAAAYEFLNIEGQYRAIDVPGGTLATFFTDNRENFEYFSLTMPLKEEVLALGIPMDAHTQLIQSANTLVKRNGSWALSSTDGTGLLAALDNAGVGAIDSVLVLGAGATARAVTGALDARVSHLHVLGRSTVRQAALEAAVTHATFSYLRWTLDIDFSHYDLVVNTTPAGAADLLEESVHPGVKATLFDVIYKPWPTELAQRWSDCGGKVINGLELLLYQGIDQLEIVLGPTFDRVALAEHLRPILLRAAH